MRRDNKKGQLKGVTGQSLLMYCALIAVVVAVLLAMAPYFKRVVQERYRQSADVFGAGEQYEKGVTEEL